MADERTEELDAIQAIFPEFTCNGRYGGTLEIPVKPTNPLLIRFVPSNSRSNVSDEPAAHIEHDIAFSVLPPLCMQVDLPPDYPDSRPPRVTISSTHDWLPAQTQTQLQNEALKLWEEYAHGQCLFAYIDRLQTAADNGFELGKGDCLVLSQHMELLLLSYQAKTKQAEFDKGTYDCTICLEPKKGTACYQLTECGHVFCKKCLQDFYNNAIDEGDIAVVRCLDPDCSKENRAHKPSLHPRELLAMELAEPIVRRYVEMKRKKRMESDKTTVYCPRSWCQGAARSIKYPPIPQDLLQYVEPPGVDEGVSDTAATDAIVNGRTDDDRLRICEKCQFAFCRTCFASWHGEFVSCRPRDPSELTAEEKASYEYIAKHTSPCPTCSSPVQKTMGCNHMQCFQCRTHFCYLCSAYLEPSDPYWHFNTAGTECYQRLWELEEGDEGQGPADGRGFGGARAWEALALEAVRQAEEEEAAAAAAAAAPNEPVAVQVVLPAQDVHLAVQPVQHANANGRGRGGIGRGGAAGRMPQNGQRRIVGLPPGHQIRRRDGIDEEVLRQDAGLRRFIELAQRDEEDEWDSDELADDDEAWRIV